MRRGFTLIELMVVIGIMALVMAIVLPAANSLLASSRAKSTLANMHVLESAISCYVQERPLQGDRRPLRMGRAGGAQEPGEFHDYARIFGPYPPSPTSAYAYDFSTLSVYTYPWTTEEDGETTVKLRRIVQKYMLTTDWDLQSFTGKFAYPSIECLVLFLTQFSTQARKIIDKLPDSAKTNKDQAYAFEDENDDEIFDRSTERAIDLFEVNDAWKNPIRYSVKEPVYVYSATAPPKLEFPAIWELRSAGPDGEFSAPWTDEDKSDDVILRSQ